MGDPTVVGAAIGPAAPASPANGLLHFEIAGVINLIDPDVVVLGGGLSAFDFLYDEVPRRWGRYIFSDTVVTRLLPPRHGDSSGVRGAAWLWPPEESE